MRINAITLDITGDNVCVSITLIVIYLLVHADVKDLTKTNMNSATNVANALATVVDV